MLLKADFHIHTREDPHDFIRYTAFELLQEAARQGFEVLALTCHNKRIHSEDLRRRAEDLGILLIPGVEAAIEGKHTLLLDCLNGKLRENLDLFDAIEFSHFYTRTVDFNRKAVEYARRMEIPLVGTSDCHRIWQLGTTYSLIDVEEKSIAGVFAAIRAGRVRVVTAPLQPLRPLRRMGERWRGRVRRPFAAVTGPSAPSATIAG
jgi:predicted metal-dependent phosphoesterase TrpH